MFFIDIHKSKDILKYIFWGETVGKSKVGMMMWSEEKGGPYIDLWCSMDQRAY